MIRIDLQKLTKNSVRSLSGHDRGSEARSFFKLDDLETSNTELTVVAPDGLDTITPSFVQGMFGRSVQKLGKDAFFLSISLLCQAICFPTLSQVLIGRNLNANHCKWFEVYGV